MRLNAIWGLENKDKPFDIQKAQVDVMQVAEGGVFYDVLPESQKFDVEDSKTTDLEIMISLFIRQPQDNGYFIYLVQGDEVDNPFDLKPMIDYVRPAGTRGILKTRDFGVKELQGDTYYTLSKKGITSYVDGKLEDYEPL